MRILGVEEMLETQVKIAIKCGLLHVFGLVWDYEPAIDPESSFGITNPQ